MAKRRPPTRTYPIHPVIAALKRARVDARISQYALAAKLDCSRSKIEHIERGHTRSPKFDFVVQWAAELGMDITTDVHVVHENAS